MSQKVTPKGNDMVHITTSRSTSTKTLTEAIKFILDLTLQESVARVEITSPNGVDLQLTVHDRTDNTKSCILRPQSQSERVFGKIGDAYQRWQVKQASAGMEGVNITPTELAAYVLDPNGKWRGSPDAQNLHNLTRKIVEKITS